MATEVPSRLLSLVSGRILLTMTDFLSALNPAQRKAAEHTEGPLLILAGAGSGKTRVITFRIAYLIDHLGVAPRETLAVTFTNKAASQMKERVAALLRDPASGSSAQISTFHSFCVRVLRQHIERLGYGRAFSIYDDDDQERLLRTCEKEMGLAEETLPLRKSLGRISHAKNSGVTPEDMYRDAQDGATEKLASLYERYVRRLREANALDFDDLLLKTVALFDHAPDVRDDYNRRFRYLMVDEYQDTNRIQYRLIRQLTESHNNICVVGDEDQSIYRWRGADVTNILNFKKDYPAAAVIRLEQNYRSTQVILDAASAVVDHNRARIGKTLWSQKTEGSLVELHEAPDADTEAAFIAERTAEALASSPEETVAVLYRTNAQSRPLEEAFRARRIRHQVIGGFRFYERAEIKDVIAYARLAVNPQDSAALLRVINSPPRGIGASTVSALQSAAQQLRLSLWQAIEHQLAANAFPARAHKALEAFAAIMRRLMEQGAPAPLTEFFKSILDGTGYIQLLEAEGTPESLGRIENLKELVNAATEAESRNQSLRDFLDHAALVSDTDDYREKTRVTLMTLHTAKGLEFSIVFLAGLEEKLFPHQLSLSEEAAIEEERRLCYVGMTRAKQRLIITRALRRRIYGEDSFKNTHPSRFLAEIPQKLIEHSFSEAPPPKPRVTWDNAYNSVEEISQYLTDRRTAFGEPRAHSRHFSPFEQSTKKLAGVGSGSGRWRLGSRVRHPKYGLGTVVECEGDGQDTKLTISFPGYGRKKLIERFAALESA